MQVLNVTVLSIVLSRLLYILLTFPPFYFRSEPDPAEHVQLELSGLSSSATPLILSNSLANVMSILKSGISTTLLLSLWLPYALVIAFSHNLNIRRISPSAKIQIQGPRISQTFIVNFAERLFRTSIPEHGRRLVLYDRKVSSKLYLRCVFVENLTKKMICRNCCEGQTSQKLLPPPWKSQKIGSVRIEGRNRKMKYVKQEGIMQKAYEGTSEHKNVIEATAYTLTTETKPLAFAN